MPKLTTTQLIDQLIAQRDELIARKEAYLKAGNIFAADDMAADVRFAIAKANDALMDRC